MIDREKVIKEYENYVKRFVSLTTSDEAEYEMHEAVLSLLKEQGEIVRCKDCKHGREPIMAYRKGCVWCERVNRHNDADWYCADGERR